MPVKILVADDSVTMRRILELTFAGEDATVTGVESGDAAVARASDLKPDVVIADVSMPSDGYKVAAAIKSTPGLEQTAVIVLASQKHPYDEAKGRGAGVDDHMLKPFDTQLVIDKVKQVMGKPRASVVSAPKPAAAPMPPPRQPMPPPQQPPAMDQPRGGSRTGTIAFGKAPVTAAGAPSPAPAQAAPPARPAPAVAAAAARAMPAASELSAKLDGMGLTSDQVAGVLELTRDVVERVVWEVVPDLAEALIKEEIRRLTS